MSRNRHIRERIDNSLTDLVSAVTIGATGGSSLSGYGTVSFANNYALVTLNRIILTYLYSGNGIFQTAIQLPIQDALSKLIEIECEQISPSEVDEVMDWFEDHNVWGKLQDWYSWVRVYGGGGLVINSDQDPEAPLNVRRLMNAPIELYDCDRWQFASPEMLRNDILDFDDILTAEYVTLNSQKIHTSRVILGAGKRAPSYIRRQLMGWGMSEGERMLRDLNNYLKTQDVLYEILDESKIDVYHIKDFANKLATRGGTSSITQRIQQANQLKNYVNALVMDSEETFEQKTMTFAGLADVMKENRIGVASALRMPMTKLFGLSASGFSTGEEDTDNYNEMVESEIRMPMRPAIRKMIEIAMANLWGHVYPFRFKFPPMKEVSALENEQIMESKSNRILAWYDRGLLDADGVADMAAKEEVLDAEIAKRVNRNPMAPNGSGSVAPPATDTISVYRKAVDTAKTAANAIKNAAARAIGR